MYKLINADNVNSATREEIEELHKEIEDLSTKLRIKLEELSAYFSVHNLAITHTFSIINEDEEEVVDSCQIQDWADAISEIEDFFFDE